MGFNAAVSDSATENRLADLLDSVRTVFAAKGFDRASMQDLAQAAGMSAGNFYRYFPSKDAIIEAMVQRDLVRVQQNFEMLLKVEDPTPLLREGILHELDTDDCEGGAIWAEIRAAAQRQSQVATLFERLEARITANLVKVFGRIAAVDQVTAEARFTAHATMIFLLIQGIKMRRKPGDGFEGSPLRALALRTIDSLLADIAGSAPAAPAEHESV